MSLQTMGARACGLLAVTLFASLLSASAVAQKWIGTDPTKVNELPAAPPYTRAHMLKAASDVNAAFANGDYALIEKMHAEYVAGKIRTTEGLWMVQAVQDGLDSAFRFYPEDVSESLFKEWQKAIPNSKLTPVAQAMRWQRLAWNARGGGVAATTPEEAFQIFRERLKKAADALKASEAVGKETPLWYWTALIVAGSSGMPTKAFDALFDESVARFPTYQTLYYTRVNYLLPQWGGDYALVDAFVRKSVARTITTEGQSFYVWIYGDILQYMRADYLEVTAATWPLMKKGFEDLVARYPDAWNKNLYATMACRARDKETTAQLLGELGAKAELGAWSRGITNESCRRFAFERT